MTLTTVYKKTSETKYMTPACSVAMLFHILSIATIIVVPAIVGFYTRNLWVSEMTYYEQPDVSFKYNLIVQLQNTGGESKLWSTWSYYNTLVQDLLSVPSVSVDDRDTDRDGVTDQLNITLQFQDLKDIKSCQTLLIFQYKLSELCDLVMETPLYITSTVTDQGVVVLGDLSLQQRQTLQPHNPHTVYNSSLIQDPSLLQSYDIVEILTSISERTLSTKLDELYSTCSPSEHFTVSYIINIPQQSIRYEPGFWEAMKYAWIQYITLLVIARYVVCAVRTFVFQNMILTTLRQNKEKSS
ncbi:hypothetical protein ACHWQZ_G008523 [Mnemiopsis leidyi]